MKIYAILLIFLLTSDVKAKSNYSSVIYFCKIETPCFRDLNNSCVNQTLGPYLWKETTEPDGTIEDEYVSVYKTTNACQSEAKKQNGRIHD